VQKDNLVEYRNPGIALPVTDALTAVLQRGASEFVAARGGGGGGRVHRVLSAAAGRTWAATSGAQ